MCGRTSLYIDQTTIEDRFDAEFAFEYEPRYNIAPTKNLATVRNTDQEHVVEQEWGLLPHWAEDTDEEPRPINARAETVDENNMFKQAYAERRCLVIADGFYEWEGERGSKKPYRVHLEDDQPFAMAGIWNRFKENDEELETVTILTTEPNDLIESIHDRMPVVLEAEDEATWLGSDEGKTLAVADPYESGDMEVYEISQAVNDPTNDRPDIILPTSS